MAANQQRKQADATDGSEDPGSQGSRALTVIATLPTQRTENPPPTLATVPRCRSSQGPQTSASGVEGLHPFYRWALVAVTSEARAFM